jgi:pimeloyl-ACP methyl ester carboxylesterase
MANNSRLLFIHGSESSSQTYKATLLRGLFPGMVTPDFTGLLDERMKQLAAIIDHTTGWTLIGSSLGGLMAALFAAQAPGQVRRLVLLAPALNWPGIRNKLTIFQIPTVIIHGTQDDVVPLAVVRPLAERIFTHLTYRVVDDDHRLHKTAEALDWRSLLEDRT